MGVFCTQSSPAKRTSGARCEDPVNLVTQFFLPDNLVRRDEILDVLKRNVMNPQIDSITLVNERLYSWDELRMERNEKVKQEVIGRWATFSDLLRYRKKGYTVVANADIFFDVTLGRLGDLDLHERKSMFALLRFEHTDENLEKCKLFGPRADSMDTWIVHSSHTLPLKLFEFKIGKPGCDNKLCFLFDLLGYEIYNDPLCIRTYHVHKSNERAYTAAERIPESYLLVSPARIRTTFNFLPADVETYDLRAGNDRLFSYIQSKKSDPFVIPRVAGIENNAAVSTAAQVPIPLPAMQALKTHAGLLFKTQSELDDFSSTYLSAFDQSELYASWEPWAKYTKHIDQWQKYVKARFPRQQFAAAVLDVYHFVGTGRPWTHALQNKKILIVSSFVDQIKNQPQAYPIDLFPGCSFVYLKPTLTQGDEPSRGWDVEYKEFCERIRELDFDVALCSCGGYGNPICAFIYSIGKSAIYVGGVLQMYFGIYGNRWLKDNPEVLKLYLKPSWKRPDVKPAGFNKIEQGCYW
jgi:hypothetical protein